MAFKEKLMYRVVCDCCGDEPEYYEEYWGYSEKSGALEYAEGFEQVGEDHLCDSCWCWPEDLPDYPGDEEWKGGDDPVRKPDCHPTSPKSGKGSHD